MPTDPSGAQQATTNNTSSFLVALVLNAAIALAVAAAFVALRPRHKRVYIPLWMTFAMPRSHREAGHISWLVDAVCMGDSTFVGRCGPDALTHVRMYRMGLELALAVGLLVCVVLLPIHATAGGGLTGLDMLSMANVPERAGVLWVHWALTVLVTCMALAQLRRYYLLHAQLRLHYLHTRPVHMHTVLVRNIPAEASREELQQLYVLLGQTPVSAVHVVVHVHRLLGLAEERDTCRRTLERLMYVHAHGTVERPTHRTRMWGLWGPRVDSIDYYERELARLNSAVSAEQAAAHRQLGAAFISYPTLAPATTLAQVQTTAHPTRHQARPAPEPRDVYWPNVPLIGPWATARKILAGCLVFVLCAFYLVPVTFVQGLTSLESLSSALPFLAPLTTASPLLRGFLQGFLPPLALRIFYMLLPIIAYWLAVLYGWWAHSGLERSQYTILMVFQVVNVLLGSVLAGTVLQRISQIADNPSQVFTLLGQALPTQATFFLTYTMLATAALPLALLRLGPLLVFTAKTRWLAKTPREKEEAWAPPPPTYGVDAADGTLFLLVGLVYSTMAPLVPLFVAAYMAGAYVVARHQALWLHAPTYQSGGLLFPYVARWVVAGLIIYQVAMIGALGLKLSPSAVVLVPLLPLTLAYGRYLQAHHHQPTMHMPLHLARTLDLQPTSHMQETADPGCGGPMPGPYHMPYVHPALTAPPAVPDTWDSRYHLIAGTRPA